MKKTLIALLCLLIPVSAIGCKKSESITVYAPDGAPALALSQMMSENFTIDGYKTEYNVVPAAQIKDKALVSDLAIVPSNMASILYNQTNGKYKLVSVNTFGNLYLLGKNGTSEISSLADLSGKTVYLTGQNGAPDLVFRHLLRQAGVFDQVTLVYKGDGSEIVPLLKNGSAEYAVLGEPAVSQSKVAAQTVELADIQALWKQATNSSVSYPQACLIVSSDFAQKHPAYVKSFAQKLQKVKSWLGENATAAGATLKDNGSLLNTNLFNASVITRCNIDYLSATDAKTMIESFFGVIQSFNPALIGGQLPDDNFYYQIG